MEQKLPDMIGELSKGMMAHPGAGAQRAIAVIGTLNSNTPPGISILWISLNIAKNLSLIICSKTWLATIWWNELSEKGDGSLISKYISLSHSPISTLT